MKREFYDSKKNNVTSKVMQFAWGILILDGIAIIGLLFLYLYIIGLFKL